MLSILLEVKFLPEAVDSFAWWVVIIGMGVVFIALALLVAIFSNIPKLMLMVSNVNLKVKNSSKNDKNTNVENLKTKSLTADVTVAIGTALHFYFSDFHDEDYTIMTIKKASKSYSPWSSKIYGLNNMYLKK